MEFKFRSINERSSTYFSPSQNFSSPSNLSHFTHQGIKAGLETTDLSHRDFSRNLNGAVQEAIQRELEKEQIRAEILAEEILRRRVLEEEVRREIMMERERVLRFGSSGSLLLEPRVSFLTNFEGRDRFRVGVSTHHESGLQVPFQRRPGADGTGNVSGISSGVTLREIKGSAAEVNKDKVIFLAKPNVNSTELKRKATPPPGGGANLELASVSVKKHKTKHDWSCALCRITATSEQGLNEHLQGKKHKNQERGLVTQKMGFGVGPSPKEVIANTSKPDKVPRKTTAKSPKKNYWKVGGKSSLTKDDENPTQKTPLTENAILQKQNSVERSAKPKKFRFWCEMCKVGAHSQNVMNSHTRGKKHQAKFQEMNQPGDHVPEKKSADIAVEKKNPDVATVVIKQETVAEEAESKEGRADSDVIGAEENKMIDSVGVDGVTEPDSDQVPASDGC